MPPKVRRTAEIRNVYETMDRDLLPPQFNPNFDIHHIKLPFRGLCCAPSGSGKTNLIFNLIEMFCTGKGTFDSIQVVTRNADEALYNQLKRDTEGKIPITEGLKSLPVLDEFDKTVNHLLILDDLVTVKNLGVVEDYYSRCRKLGVSVMFITQSFFRTPLFMRINCNYVILLKTGSRGDLQRMLGEYSLGVTKEQLDAMYRYATNRKFSPLIIDLEAPEQEKFRKGFDEFLDPAQFG